jgi:hypothetical protein
MNEDAIISAVDNLQRIFTIVLALSLGEAFKQFVSDHAVKPEDRTIRWDRLMALCAFLLLLIPFYHGMGRYFFDVYQTPPRPEPYSRYLLIDSLAFIAMASLFFVMCRELPAVQWRRFYCAVVGILLIDMVWGIGVWLSHRQANAEWLILNAIALPVLVIILAVFRSPRSTFGPILALLAMIVRTVADYWVSWSFFFPQ